MAGPALSNTHRMRARERILDAVELLLRQSGFSAVNVMAVAAQAGVSRQTVYSHFGTREELVSQAVIRINARVLDEVNRAVGGLADAGDYLVEFMVAVRGQFRRNQVLGTLLLDDQHSPLFEADMAARARPVVPMLMTPLVERAPHLAGREDDFFELVFRMALALLLFESDGVRADDDLRGFLRRTVLPALGL
jgi:AcrR family transcriptional regulator